MPLRLRPREGAVGRSGQPGDLPCTFALNCQPGCAEGSVVTRLPRTVCRALAYRPEVNEASAMNTVTRNARSVVGSVAAVGSALAASSVAAQQTLPDEIVVTSS